MADAMLAIEFVLDNEDGFVDNKNDSGGATNFGISLRFLRTVPVERLRKYGFFKEPNQLAVSDIHDMTQGQAIAIYGGEFWEQARFDLINDQLLCNYLFDSAILHGIVPALKLAQRGSWAVYRKIGYLKADGVLGHHTLKVLNDLGDSFLPVLIAMRASYCRLLAEIRPKDMEFLDGWLKRCYRI